MDTGGATGISLWSSLFSIEFASSSVRVISSRSSLDHQQNLTQLRTYMIQDTSLWSDPSALGSDKKMLSFIQNFVWRHDSPEWTEATAPCERFPSWIPGLGNTKAVLLAMQPLSFHICQQGDRMKTSPKCIQIQKTRRCLWLGGGDSAFIQHAYSLLWTHLRLQPNKRQYIEDYNWSLWQTDNLVIRNQFVWEVTNHHVCLYAWETMWCSVDNIRSDRLRPAQRMDIGNIIRQPYQPKRSAWLLFHSFFYPFPYND